MENYYIHTLPYFSEGFLSIYRNLFTYQWRHLRAFGKKLGIHFFSLGQKRFFLHQADFLCILWATTQVHNLPTEGLAASFTSFCGFQGQNERECCFLHQNIALFSYFMNMWKCFLKQELYSYFLLLPVDAEKDGETPHTLRTPPLHANCFPCMHNLLQKADTSVNSKTLSRQMESTVLRLPEEHIVRLHFIVPCRAVSLPAEHSLSFPQERGSWHQ